MLFSATMVKKIEKKLDRKLIFGDNKKELIEIGNTEAANEEF